MLSEYSSRAITVGANNAGKENCDAHVGEVLVYDRALSEDERGAVGDYLAGKYSIETKYAALPRDVAGDT